MTSDTLHIYHTGREQLKKYFFNSTLFNLCTVLPRFLSGNNRINYKSSFTVFALFLFFSCAGTNGNVQSSDNQMLFIAVMQGNLAQTEKFLKEGASPNSKGPSGNTLLSTACHAGNGEMMDLLFKYKADPNYKNKDATIPLNYAFKPYILKKLIDNGADIYLVTDPKNGTAFEMWCFSFTGLITEAQKKQTMYILRSQKIKTTREQLEKTQWVTDKDVTEIISLYQKRGYDINKSFNKSHTTPLHYAAYNDSYMLMHKLLSVGAKVNPSDKYHDDQLSIISKNPNSTKTGSEFKTILYKLLAAGADINTTDCDGDTPLINATDVNSLAKINVILAIKGVDKHKTGHYGETALFRAQSFAVTKTLVTAGLKVNAANKYNLTPLFSVNDTESVLYLINKGADVNHVDDDNENVLLSNMHHAFDAIMHGASSEAMTARYIGKVKILISKGIDVNCKAKKTGYTALSWAKRAELDKIIELLKKAGAR